jgi:uncharacterized protein (DUF4415 family)
MPKNKGGLGTNLAKVDATTDEEIARQIAEDADLPELTDEGFAEADIYEGDRFVRRVGRPKGGKKELVTLRVDRDLLDHFRAGGPGWQTRLNDALRSMITVQSASKENRQTASSGGEVPTPVTARASAGDHGHRARSGIRGERANR